MKFLAVSLSYPPPGCHSYSVPVHIKEHIDLIKPTVHFSHTVPSAPFQKRSFQPIGMPSSSTGPKTNGVKVKEPPSLVNCDEIITPDCLRALYSIDYKPVATRKNSYGIGQYVFSKDFIS